MDKTIIDTIEDDSGIIKADTLKIVIKELYNKHEIMSKQIQELIEVTKSIDAMLTGYNGSGIVARVSKAEADINAIASLKFKEIEDKFNDKLDEILEKKISPLQKTVYMACGAIALLGIVGTLIKIISVLKIK